MIKKLVLASCAAFLACSADCLDLILKNGSIYKDVTIVTKTPGGMDIQSHRDGDITIFRHVRYSELSPESLKHFPDYNKPKADEHIASVKAKYDLALASHSAKQADWVKKDEADEPITYPSLPASTMVLKATKDLKHGTIGWATSEEATGPSVNGHFGKIYVYGLKITEGNEWAGKLYLTNKSMQDGNEVFPCYVTSQDMADSLNKRPN